MADMQLKKMKRSELLELLIERTRQIDQLKTQIEGLERQLNEKDAQLKERKIAIENAGSLAEASVHINGMFAAAQNSADQFLENIRRMHEEAKANCTRMEAECQKRCYDLEKDAQRRCNDLVSNAKHDAGRNWNELAAQLERISKENEELRGLLTQSSKKRIWSK